jgi:DNA invertase Pin-like site-specific DNA recombinase
MFGYCRISCKKQVSHGDSLNEQDQHIREYCKSNNINLINVFTEDVISELLLMFLKDMYLL